MSACERLRTIKIREEEYEVPCGSRYCPACGVRWMQDQRVRAVAAVEHVKGDVGLITITGPGNGFFKRAREWHGWSHAHAVGAWNASARRRWRRLHQRASAAPRKWDRMMGSNWRMLYRVWEYQKRGVLHIHVVVPMGTWAERCASRRYLRAVVRLAETYGFGRVLGGDADVWPEQGEVPPLVRVDGARAARYVAKYVANTGAGKDNLVSTVKRTATRGSILYVSATLTKVSGVTMTTLAARRRIHARYPWARDSTAGWRAARLVDAMQRGRAPFTQEAVVALRRAALRQRPDRWVDTETGESGALTAAPVPLRAYGNIDPRPTDGGDLRVALASVLVRVSSAPWLGPVRTEVVAC